MRMAEAFEEKKVLYQAFFYKSKYFGIKEILSQYNIKSKINLKFFFLSPAPFFNFLESLIIPLRIKYNKNNIIYCRNLKCAVVNSLLRRNVIFETHQPLKNYTRFDFLLLKFSLNFLFLKKIVVISHALKRIVEKETNGKIDLLVLPDAAKKQKIRKFIKKSEGIGYFGSLLDGRGIDLIINLAKQFPQYPFHIAGGNHFLINKWKELSPKNLIFHGFLKQFDLIKLSHKIDIFLAPYQKNTTIPGNKITSEWMSPLKIFEYMSFKKPIIASDLPVIKEVLTHKKNSLLVEPNDFKGWVKNIKLLKENKALSNQISANSFKDFINNYTWDIRINKILDFYDK